MLLSVVFPLTTAFNYAFSAPNPDLMIHLMIMLINVLAKAAHHPFRSVIPPQLMRRNRDASRCMVTTMLCCYYPIA